MRVRGNIGNPHLLPVINHGLYSHLAEYKYSFEGLNITQRLLSVFNSVIFFITTDTYGKLYMTGNSIS